jgi:hypothetical protein
VVQKVLIIIKLKIQLTIINVEPALSHIESMAVFMTHVFSDKALQKNISANYRDLPSHIFHVVVIKDHQYCCNI